MPNCNSNQRERMTMPMPMTMPAAVLHACDPAFDPRTMPVGMAYVPWQCFDTVYEVDKALEIGTIFPELNKPFVGRRIRGR